ncbi:MAG: hypothetical protein AAFP13_13625 [Pseudomonadota bacterium]
MAADKPPVFLERASYRRRRIADAARVLPVFGGGLVMVPLIWAREGEGAVTTVDAFLYIFGIWALMIGLAAFMAPLLKRIGRG